MKPIRLCCACKQQAEIEVKFPRVTLAFCRPCAREHLEPVALLEKAMIDEMANEEAE